MSYYVDLAMNQQKCLVIIPFCFTTENHCIIPKVVGRKLPLPPKGKVSHDVKNHHTKQEAANGK